jgi:hypothetical protein
MRETTQLSNNAGVIESKEGAEEDYAAGCVLYDDLQYADGGDGDGEGADEDFGG